jgi:hypothetical protein
MPRPCDRCSAPYGLFLRGGLVAWICGPSCQACTHSTPRRQRRPTRLPPHHAPGSLARRSRTQIYRSEGFPHAASIEGMQPRAVEVGCGPGQRPLREGPRTRYDWANTPALVVRGGPGESRGLSHFSFWNVASARISTIKIKHCFAILASWCLASGLCFDEPHHFCMLLRAYCDWIETKIHLAESRFVPAPRLFLRHTKTLAHGTSPPTTPGQ